MNITIDINGKDISAAIEPRVTCLILFEMLPG